MKVEQVVDTFESHYLPLVGCLYSFSNTSNWFRTSQTLRVREFAPAAKQRLNTMALGERLNYHYRHDATFAHPPGIPSIHRCSRHCGRIRTLFAQRLLGSGQFVQRRRSCP